MQLKISLNVSRLQEVLRQVCHRKHQSHQHPVPPGLNIAVQQYNSTDVSMIHFVRAFLDLSVAKPWMFGPLLTTNWFVHKIIREQNVFCITYLKVLQFLLETDCIIVSFFCLSFCLSLSLFLTSAVSVFLSL